MRIRELASALRESVAHLPPPERAEKFNEFVAWLTLRRRRKLLPRILAALAQLETESGRAPMVVTVPNAAHGMPEGAEVHVSPSMLGGATVRIGDSRVDTSISTQLSRLSHILKS
jgi:F0F1-type ATP synthase delta subunit